jgi:hypothetical protein
LLRRLALLGAVLALLSAATAAAAVVSDGPRRQIVAKDESIGTANGDSLGFAPVIGLPATNVALIGASAEEAEGEVWAQGRIGDIPATAGSQEVAKAAVLLRYTSSDKSWQVVPVANAEGQPLSFDWWGSEVTPQGGVLLAGEGQQSGGGSLQSVVTRNPGGSFTQAPAPAGGGAEAVVSPSEDLFPRSSSAGRQSSDPLIATFDEKGVTQALVVPVWQTSGKALAPGVLRYDGHAWTREPLCSRYESEACTPISGTVEPLAIAAASPQSAWLLARGESGQVELFQRQVGEAHGTPVWIAVQFSSGLLSASGVPAGESVAAPSGGAILTATSQGVWVDLDLTGAGGQSGSATLLASATQHGGVDSGQTLGTWCYPSSLCPGAPSLEAALPSDYASFAWPGSAGQPGSRVITGLPDGALLRLQEGQAAFRYEPGGGAGGANGAVGPGGVTVGQLPGLASMAAGGAAFASPTEGWLGDDSSSDSSQMPQVIQAAPQAGEDRLQSWPVSLRSPLLAIATEPGSSPGAANAQALAVGADGAVARYVPGQGWTPEYLYNSSGERQTPNLRGVAWPQPGRAYAVGDNGAMWLWQADSGLWEPDPAEPLGFRGQLTAIAFSPSDPEVGYAVGKQGVLLAYGKTWTQETLPPGLSAANFTSVAFAGNEAIATYRMLSPSASNPNREVGGVIMQDGSGWQVDPSAQALLSQMPPQETVLSKVAALPDGGAVAAGPGLVIERDSGGSPWRFAPQPLPEAGNVSALAAVQEGSTVRALVSLDPGDDPNNSPIYEEIDNPQGPALGEYGELLGSDPLPEHGYLLRETSTGWQDEEHQAYPRPAGDDLPGWPDAVLALDIDSSGEQGWAVGGQTGEELAVYGSPGAQEQVQTGGVMRYGVGPAVPLSTSAPISVPSGQVSFAVGGNAQCASSCAAFTNEQIGPDSWLSSAISRAEHIGGLSAFLYTGTRVAGGSGAELERELSLYASLLQGSSLPVFAAISPSDIPTTGGGPTDFEQALGDLAPAGQVQEGPAPPAGDDAYVRQFPGAEGQPIRVIVLDYSGASLTPNDTASAACPVPRSAEPTNQLQWLCSQLYDASSKGIPTIVMGNRDITDAGASNYAQDAAAVRQVLLEGGASAYLFDSPEENLSTRIGPSGKQCESLPAYGTGTLGYVSPALDDPQDFLGASGFLTVSVNTNTAKRCAGSDRAPVSTSLIPSIGQLGVEASNGTQLHRSHVGLFQGLARRPLGGEKALLSGGGDVLEESPDPYTPIPETCEGTNCSQFIAPAYTFSSSDPEVGNFVEQDPSSTNPRAVLQVNGKPVTDPTSGLFCAFNAGTTTITLTTGGLSYSEQVTVQAGSVEQPCGTVPLAHPPQPAQSQITNPIVPAPTLTPTPSITPQLLIAPPPPLAPLSKPPQAPSAFAPPLAAASAYAPVRAALPAPAPQPARPTPPSGSAQVTQPVGVAEQERESEQAVDVVHNMAAYDGGANAPTAPPPWAPVALAVIAAGAGAGIRRARRQRAPAWAGVSTEAPRVRRRR